MQIIDSIPVFGIPQPNAVEQMKRAMRTAYKGALMADHHLGYAVPVGGVISYVDEISPSGVGYDIACGNKAVLTDAKLTDLLASMGTIMDDIFSTISFGIGRKNNEPVDDPLFDDSAWDIPVISELKQMAQEQLGTVGSGNHYVDIFADDEDRIWIGCHFGSRGLGHKIATYYIRSGGGTDGVNVDPVVLSTTGGLGAEYVDAMKLAGKYAYAGRDWVCSRVAKILGATILKEVHNHHNFAWKEEHDNDMIWVVRKGATPAFSGQQGFIGSTMAEKSYIVEGVESELSQFTLSSTVHGAGRVMSRTEAAGKVRWKKGVKTRLSEGKISQDDMDQSLEAAGVVLRGGGRDEAPQAYKRLVDVISAQGDTVKILHELRPLGVAMAGEGEFDPYKD